MPPPLHEQHFTEENKNNYICLHRPAQAVQRMLFSSIEIQQLRRQYRYLVNEWKEGATRFFVSQFPYTEEQIMGVAEAYFRSGYTPVSLLSQQIDLDNLRESIGGFYLFLPQPRPWRLPNFEAQIYK